jgi:hypothetical protein
MIKLRQWHDIAHEYEDTLIIGNGASIALSPEFSYASILETCRANNLVTQDVDAVFAHAATSDFELVMRMLWHASHVNRALKIVEQRTEKLMLTCAMH